MPGPHLPAAAPCAIPPNNPVKLCHPHPLTPPFYTCRIKLSSTTVEQKEVDPMFATLFASLFVQGILLGLAALALLAAAPRLQKRYGPQWLCRLWVTLAVLLLVPLHALLCPRPRRRCPWIPHRRCTAGPPFRRKSPSAPPTVCPHGCHGGRRAHGLHRAPRRAADGTPHGAGTPRRRRNAAEPAGLCVEPRCAGCCALSIWRLCRLAHPRPPHRTAG